MKRLDMMVGKNLGATQFANKPVQYVVETPDGVLYVFLVQTDDYIAYRKSSDGGLTWGPVVVFSDFNVVMFSVWYDRWSGINAGLIHVAYTLGGGVETRYRTLDTESSDALSTIVIVHSNIGVGHIAVTRARGGNVYIHSSHSGAGTAVLSRLLNADVPNGAWAARTASEAYGGDDAILLAPGFASDNQDLLAVFWDASVEEYSRKIYDDSADAWSETSILAESPRTAAWPLMALTVDLTNSQILVLTIGDTDVLGWTVTEGAITAFTTAPILNTSVYCPAICIDSAGRWYVLYGLGDDVMLTASTDSGATWSTPIALTSSTTTLVDNGKFAVTPRFTFSLAALILAGSSYDLRINVPYPRSVRGELVTP